MPLISLEFSIASTGSSNKSSFKSHYSPEFVRNCSTDYVSIFVLAFKFILFYVINSTAL